MSEDEISNIVNANKMLDATFCRTGRPTWVSSTNVSVDIRHVGSGNEVS
jgi:hypothetical protein